MRFDFYTPSEISKSLGKLLKQQRLYQNLTQVELAQRAGIGLSTVCRIESGEGGTLDNVIRYAMSVGLVNEFADLYETRIGQQGSITRIWHYRGKRPRVVRQQQFISTYLYGAVCPATGQSVGLIMPYANGECMKRHLQEISQAVPKGRHAVVVMDGAVWHKERYNLPNLTILKLPPYSPELNPIEQVWQYIKQHWLSNRCFDSYEAIVDAACQAWCNFAKQMATVRSLTARHWAVL